MNKYNSILGSTKIRTEFQNFAQGLFRLICLCNFQIKSCDVVHIAWTRCNIIYEKYLSRCMFRFVTNTSRGDVEDQETIDWSTMPFQLLIDEDVFDNENDDDGTRIMKSLTDPLRHSASY